MNKYFKSKVENIIEDNQFGFKPEKGTKEALFRYCWKIY